MFLKFFPIILKKGINVEALLSSKIFSVRIDFNDCPGKHTNLQDCIRPYNGSFFQIRHMYRHVFPEPEFDPLSHNGKKECGHKIDSRKIYKIKYSVNLLP